MSWQPIDTAPNDGVTAILVYVPGYVWPATERNPKPRELAPEIVTVRRQWSCCELCLAGSHAEDKDAWPEPTHWMPLPAPPTGETK